MSDSSVEFSRPVRVSELPASGLHVQFEADDDERAALAGRLGVEAVLALGIDVTIVPGESGVLSVRGRVTGEVEQICSVSLDTMVNAISEPVAASFIRGKSRKLETDADGEYVIDPEAEEDEPEVLEGTALDIGEIAAEHAVLAVDPFPRKPDADTIAIPDSGVPDEGPFAVLKAMKGSKAGES